MNINMTPVALTLFAGVAAIIGGCAVNKQIPSPESDFRVLGTVSPGSPLPAPLLFRPAEESVRFDIVDGDGVGGSVLINRAETERFGAHWADEEAGIRTEFFRVGEEGKVLLTAAIDFDDNAITLFDPPLTAVHSILRPGMAQTEEVAMRVLDLRNPQRQRATGTAKQTIEHLGERRVRTPEADFIAECVEIRFAAKLGLAKATQETMLYIVDGIGIVAAEHKEQVTALGLYNRTHRRTLVRRDVLPVEPTASVRR